MYLPINNADRFGDLATAEPSDGVGATKSTGNPS